MVKGNLFGFTSVKKSVTVRLRLAVALLASGSFMLGACATSADSEPGLSGQPSSATEATPPPERSASAAADSPTSTPAPTTITVAAVGDIMLDRSIGARLRSEGPGALFEDARLAEMLAAADVAVANLESPISTRGAPVDKSYTFRAPPVAAEAVALAGFDGVALANNHALDYGPQALIETAALLARQGVRFAGGGSNADEALAAFVLERNGFRIAVVSLVDAPPEGTFNRANWEAKADRPGIAWADTETVTEAVTAAAADADIVIAMLHFGNEYASAPTASQRALSHGAIDAGALLVVGSHPHVLQEVEEYGGGLIAYSLGNFVFDGFEGEANNTAILQVTLAPGRVLEWGLVPATIDWTGRPTLD